MREYDSPEIIQPIPEAPEKPELSEGQKADQLLENTLLNELPIEELPSERLEKIESAFDQSAEIQKYRRSETTVDQLEELAPFVNEQCRAKGLDQATTRQIKEVSARQLQSIITACHEYGRSVDRFKRTKMVRLHKDSEKFAATLADWDLARRRKHEAMIDTFRAFNRYHSVVLHERYSIDVPPAMLIGDAIMRDRDIASQWALATDYYLRAKHLVELIRKKKEQPLEAAPASDAAA